LNTTTTFPCLDIDYIFACSVLLYGLISLGVPFFEVVYVSFKNSEGKEAVALLLLFSSSKTKSTGGSG